MDELIIKKLKQGDERAFRLIYDRHYVLLCRFANRLLDNKDLAEEIVDDVIFWLWEHRSELDITGSVRAYLMRAVRNRCLNELTARMVRKEVRLSSFMLPENMELMEILFVEKNHPLGYLLEQELEKELFRIIEELPIECRAVFKKSRFEQKSYEEIAREQNISINTVKYHIKNALAFLQKRLQGYLHLLIFYFFMEI